jgi:hypothetical protein
MGEEDVLRKVLRGYVSRFEGIQTGGRENGEEMLSAGASTLYGEARAFQPGHG